MNPVKVQKISQALNTVSRCITAWMVGRPQWTCYRMLMENNGSGYTIGELLQKNGSCDRDPCKDYLKGMSPLWEEKKTTTKNQQYLLTQCCFHIFIYLFLSGNTISACLSPNSSVVGFSICYKIRHWDFAYAKHKSLRDTVTRKLAMSVQNGTTLRKLSFCKLSIKFR